MDFDFFRFDLLNKQDEVVHQPLRLSNWGLIFLGFLYQLLFIFQGLDFSDTGFHLVAYQQIFDAPQTVHYSFMFWLSCVFGGMLMELFPSGGLLWNRFCSVLLYSGMFVLFYRMLTSVISRNKVIFYLFLSLLFFQHAGFETLNYDSFSIFSYALTVYFLYQGLITKKHLAFFLGGFVAGVMVYFRISNLAGGAFLVLALLLSFFDKKNWQIVFRQSLSIGWGYVLGHALVLLLMFYLGHLDLFGENLRFVSQMGKDSNSTHGLLPLMLHYLRGWAVAIVLGFGFLVALFLYQKINEKRAISSNGLYILLGFGFLIFLVLLYQNPNPTWSKIRYVYYGLIAFSGILALFIQNFRLQALLLFGVALCFLFPLGSDSGTEKVYFATGLSGALLFYILDNCMELAHWQVLKKTTLTMFVASCLMYAWSNVYFDDGSRLEKRFSVNHPLLQGIYTTPERAQVIDELLTQLPFFVKKESNLFTFCDIPMVNYLTDCQPFLGTAWPKMYYAPSIFKTEFEKSISQKGHPDIIILHKVAIRDDWPMNAEAQFWAKGSGKYQLSTQYELVFDFIKTEKYSIAWENEAFIIYKH